MTKISVTEYNELRRAYLPENSIIQEKECSDFLNTFSDFYKGEDFILCSREQDGILFATEILGKTENAPKILSALGYERGVFRGVGNQIPFSMIIKFDKIQSVTYFGHALD